MARLSTPEELLDRVRAAKGPDRDLDRDIRNYVTGKDLHILLPPLTGDLDKLKRFIAHMLPGWCGRVGWCSVSDDAWLVPDFNDPVHGERLQALFPDEAKRDPVGWFGTDVDRRPPGQPALALLESFLIAWEKRNG